MRVCSTCHRISGTDDDHLDCRERRRIELEDGGLGGKMDVADNPGCLAGEIRAVLDHMEGERCDG